MLVIWAIMMITTIIVIVINKIIEKLFFRRMKEALESNRLIYEEKELKD